MNIWDNLKNLFGGRIEFKKAFEMQRIGMNGQPQAPETDRASLINWSKRNELVYACIRKKCEAANDPEPIVERRNAKGEWETIEGHPLIALLKKPNPGDTFDTFLTAWIGSEEVTGDFYAEKLRSGSGQVVEMYPLNPAQIQPIPQGAKIVKYRYTSLDGRYVDIPAEDILHSKRFSLTSRFFGESPLKIAMSSVDADQSQTDFVRAFFHGDGIPSGLLKVKNRAMSPEESEDLQQRWMRKYSRNGRNYKQVAVLDEDAEYQQIGSNLKEVEADIVRMQNETRICMVFGVPPALVGAYVGLKLATNNATMRSHLTDFWENTMSPLLKSKRVFLTQNLLSEFESIDDIENGKIRVAWDMTTVMALQEDESERHNRTRQNFAAGFITLNEARQGIGLDPLPECDYFLTPNVTAITPELQAEQAAEPPLEPKLLTGETVEGEIVEEKSRIIEESRPSKRDGIITIVTDTMIDDDGFKGESIFGNLSGITKIKGSATAGDSFAVKKFEFDGLTLSREPSEIEKKLDLKGMVNSFTEGKDRLARRLLTIREDLIKQSVDAVDGLSEKDSYALTLTPPTRAYKKVIEALRYDFEAGQKQIAIELGEQPKGLAMHYETKALGIEEILTKLSELTISQIINLIQKSAIDWFTTFGIFGFSKEKIKEKLKEELEKQSARTFENIASQMVNSAINKGRDAEMEARKDEIQYYQYSAILDKSVCEECEALDGEQVDDRDELPDVPNEDCLGMANCRCMILPVSSL